MRQNFKEQDSSISTVTRQMVGEFYFCQGQRFFFSGPVQTSFGVHLGSYTLAIGFSVIESERARAWRWSLSLTSAKYNNLVRYCFNLSEVLFKHKDKFILSRYRSDGPYTLYCDVYDWRPSLLGNRKFNTPMYKRDSSTVGSNTLTNLVLLVTIATNSRKASVGRIATNSRKASVGRIATNIRKASVFYRAVRVLCSGQQQRAPVSLWNQSEWVSLRKQKSSVLAVRSQCFRRVPVASRVRSFSMYLVVSCVSQLVIAICVVIISIANKFDIQSEPSSSY
jgi:hypothetical protein